MKKLLLLLLLFGCSCEPFKGKYNAGDGSGYITINSDTLATLVDNRGSSVVLKLTKYDTTSLWGEHGQFMYMFVFTQDYKQVVVGYGPKDTPPENIQYVRLYKE